MTPHDSGCIGPDSGTCDEDPLGSRKLLPLATRRVKLSLPCIACLQVRRPILKAELIFVMGTACSCVCDLLFGKKELRILMVGLDAAGKTTILYKLKLGEVETVIPTIGFNIETLHYKNITFMAFDVGGCQRALPLWTFFQRDTHGIIFVVDSNDRDRMDAARDELALQLQDTNVSGVSLLVFCNKQDLPRAMSVAEVTAELGLESCSAKQWRIQSSRATTGEGLKEGLKWLINAIETPSTITS